MKRESRAMTTLAALVRHAFVDPPLTGGQIILIHIALVLLCWLPIIGAARLIWSLLQ